MSDPSSVWRLSDTGWIRRAMLSTACYTNVSCNNNFVNLRIQQGNSEIELHSYYSEKSQYKDVPRKSLRESCAFKYVRPLYSLHLPSSEE